MKKNCSPRIPFLVFCLLFLCNHNFYAQKDTLHIYFKALNTEILDSNDAKIAKWGATLKGRHATVEIYTYYDNSDFKKYMAERAENVNRIVIRKARDYTTIKFVGPIKGKKTQRSVADIVYYSGSAPAAAEVKSDSKKSTAAPAVTDNGKNQNNTKSPKSVNKKEEPDNSASTTEASPAEPPKETKERVAPKKGDYVIDSVYINGVLKVKKRKVKSK